MASVQKETHQDSASEVSLCLRKNNIMNMKMNEYENMNKMAFISVLPKIHILLPF